MRLLRALEAHFERAILAIILFALVAILAAQVVFRYIVGSPLVWSEELARYLLVWCTFIGVSLAVREGRNISVDLLPVLCGTRWLRAFAVLALLGSGLFFALMVWYSVPLTQRIAKIGQASPGLGIQMWLVYLAVPVGMGMALLRALQALWLLVRDGAVPGLDLTDEHAVIHEDV
ncbi:MULTISPECIES: TRAP transporter small permease [unclassified Salipiger]|uniref:TRAP transporter small permease n=1 Tax=unclassified Salipiger TaxID=2640570 RepID=UPI0013B6984E|nr:MULTISPECIES: TRAP transporter small permease [unclassified Salipiger]NDV52251.1 TRAP transporter small permease [Salipiger sp. PrR003]NDW31873.1 TRAP transporter small permease [Salipiger sp. PrR007]